MKKGIIIVICLIAFGIFAFAGYHIMRNEFSDEADYSEEGDFFPKEYEAYMVREKYPTDIIWYGEFEPFEEGYEVSPRFPEDVTKETLKKRNGYQYAYIVANDIDGTMDLTEENYELIYETVSRDENYHFIYIGNRQIALLEKIGYAPMGAGNETDLSLGLYHNKNGVLVPCFGLYQAEDQEDGFEILYAVLDGLLMHIE